jgi:hypothetical protein
MNHFRYSVVFLIIFLGLLFFPSESFGEKIPYKQLSWSDFQGIPGTWPESYSGDRSDYTAFTWTYLGANWKFSETSSTTCRYEFTQIDVIASFSSNESWVKERGTIGENSNRLLKHEQGHLDITEIHARAFEKELRGKIFACPNNHFDVGKINEITNQVFNKHWSAMGEMNRLYDDETGHYSNIEKQNDWNQKFDCMLKNNGPSNYCQGLKSNETIIKPVKVKTDYYTYDVTITAGEKSSRTSGGAVTPVTNNNAIHAWRDVSGQASTWVSPKKLDFGILDPGETYPELSWSVSVPEHTNPGEYSFEWSSKCETFETKNPCTNISVHQYTINVIAPQSIIPVPQIPSITIPQTTISKEYTLPDYKKTSFIPITGQIESGYVRGIPVTIIIEKPTGEIEKIGRLVSKNGSYKVDFELKHNSTIGQYKISVEYNSQSIDKFIVNVKENTSKQPVLEKPVKETGKIPTWIKNNAKWWADGQIDDKSFVQGIEFLIKEKIVSVSGQAQTKSSNQKIPNGVKTNTGWWANGQISEDDFVNGIKYMIENGIIQIPSENIQSQTFFKTYQNNEHEFSMDYPTNWHIDDEPLYEEDWIGIVWFLPIANDYANSISVSLQIDDFEYRGISTDQYLEKLVEFQEDSCMKFNFQNDGHTCTNFEIIDISSEIDDLGNRWYLVLYSHTNTYENGNSIKALTGTGEMPHGDNTFQIYLEFDESMVDIIEESEWNIIEHMMTSFRVN